MEMKTSFKTLNHEKLKWKLLWSFTVFYCKLLRKTDSWGLGNEGLVTQIKTQGTAWLYFVKLLQVLSEAVSGVRGGGVVL